MNIDYSRCMVTASEHYPETAACKATKLMLERLGAGSVTLVKGDDYKVWTELKPTYIADFGSITGETAVERLIYTSDPLTIEVFMPRVGGWHLVMPVHGYWELKSEYLYNKMKEAKVGYGRSGNNTEEWWYMDKNQGAQRLVVYMDHYQGPCV